MTSDGDALFRAVCESPADDTPRLAYADWLEENGRPERAEFIRLQCEARHLCPGFSDLTAARNRASQLLEEFGDEWWGELPIIPCVVWGNLFVRGFIDTAHVYSSQELQPGRRGLWRARRIPPVTEVLDRAFAATPLQRLTLLGFTPEQLRELLTYPLLKRLDEAHRPRLPPERPAGTRLRRPGPEDY
jgi:uncharacterized protein (TIGR02996 family)